MFPEFVAQGAKVKETMLTNNKNAAAGAKDLYRGEMQKLFGDSQPLIDESELLDNHQMIKQMAQEFFEQQPNKGNEDLSKPFLAILDKVLVSFILLNMK